MNELEMAYYLLGKAHVNNHEKDGALDRLLTIYNDQQKNLHDALTENELANRDAQQLRERLEALIARCGVEE